MRRLAARDGLRAELRLEGNVFTSLTARNVHMIGLNHNPVESIDIDQVRLRYSLIGLLRHGAGDFLRTAEVRSARVVLDPARAKLKKAPPPNEKIRLPSLVPEVLRLSDVSLVIRDTPHDTLIEHVDLQLEPGQEHDFHLGHLQLSGGQKFERISGRSSFENRNLILRKLDIGGDHFQLVQLDASRIQQKILEAKVESDLAGGHLFFSGSLREMGVSLQAEAHLLVTNVPADVLNKYIGRGCKLSGRIENVKLDGAGLFNVPRTWTGEISAQVHELRDQYIGVDACTVQLSVRDGQATLQSAEIVQGQNRLQVHGSGLLPQDVGEFLRMPATLEFSAAATDLSLVTADLPRRLTGAAEAKGKIEIKEGRLNADVTLTAGPVGFEEGSFEKLSATVQASRNIPAAGGNEPWFAGLKSTGTLAVSQVRVRAYAIDSIEGKASSMNDRLSLEQLIIKRAANELALHGEYQLPAHLRKALEKPARVEMLLNAPQLADYWEKTSPDQVSGPLQVDGEIAWQNGSSNGRLNVYGGDLKLRDLVFHQFNAQCVVADNVAYLNDLTAALNDHDFVSANGHIDFRAPHDYAGKVAASVTDLSGLQPLLRTFGNGNQLSGSIVLDWEGTGRVQQMNNNTGKLHLSLEKGRYGDLQSLQAKVDATYSPEGLNVPIIFLASNKMDFQASAQTKGETFEISRIQVDQGKSKYASGYVSLPFIWKNLGTNSTPVPPDGPVLVSFQSENIDVKRLFDDVGVPTAASGLLNVKMDAHGTLAQLQARLDVQARDLRSEHLPDLEPASFDLTAEADGEQIKITGKLQQSKIQPLQLTASLPFRAATVLRERKVPETTPIMAHLMLARSSVNFLRQFVPQVEQLDGDVALDVNIGGTMAQPVFSGSGDMNINVARSSNVTLPALRGFKARLKFLNDALTIEQLGADLSGGSFRVTGGVKFPKLTQANLDLQVKADSALVARNDTVTARINADLQVTGPFTAATVKGTVEFTNSQFLKNLDLIPIGLPGRPAPQPSSDRPDFSLPDAPLRDWKFDVAIKTKDPFRIRGNLANGGATTDLHLIGTGLHPGLEGTVRLQNVEATLPFSRLDIEYGFLYFDPGDPFNPRIDLHGTSVIRDYTIHVYIYGTSLAPEAVFSSEPPLPQEDVISLLATGTTREQLTGGNDVIAGRAAMLLVQQLYRKIFRQGKAAQNTSVLDRLDVDVGQTDPRTGQRRATARLKLNDQFVLVGDLDVGGGFRGMVRYVIRFR